MHLIFEVYDVYYYFVTINASLYASLNVQSYVPLFDPFDAITGTLINEHALHCQHGTWVLTVKLDAGMHQHGSCYAHCYSQNNL